MHAAAVPDAITFTTGDARAPVCPETYSSTADAKPNTDMVQLLARHLLQVCPRPQRRQNGCRATADLKGYFVGDRATDLLCGMRSGLRPVLVLTGRGRNTLKELETAAAVHPLAARGSPTAHGGSVTADAVDRDSAEAGSASSCGVSGDTSGPLGRAADAPALDSKGVPKSAAFGSTERQSKCDPSTRYPDLLLSSKALHVAARTKYEATPGAGGVSGVAEAETSR